MASAKVVTGRVRLSYVHVKNPQSYEGSDPKYSVTLLIPKKDKKTLKLIEEATKQVKKDAVADTWGGKLPNSLKLPLRDGDDERPDQPEFADMYFVNATSKRRPGVLDKDGEEMFDLDELYSGCYARVSMNLYPFSVKGNRGIAAGLNGIKKLADGEQLGGGGFNASDFDDDFEDIDDDDDLL
jgi:hypothetical protein